MDGGGIEGEGVGDGASEDAGSGVDGGGIGFAGE